MDAPREVAGCRRTGANLCRGLCKLHVRLDQRVDYLSRDNGPVNNNNEVQRTHRLRLVRREQRVHNVQCGQYRVWKPARKSWGSTPKDYRQWDAGKKVWVRGGRLTACCPSIATTRYVLRPSSWSTATGMLPLPSSFHDLAIPQQSTRESDKKKNAAIPFLESKAAPERVAVELPCPHFLSSSILNTWADSWRTFFSDMAPGVTSPFPPIDTRNSRLTSIVQSPSRCGPRGSAEESNRTCVRSENLAKAPDNPQTECTSLTLTLSTIKKSQPDSDSDSSTNIDLSRQSCSYWALVPRWWIGGRHGDASTLRTCKVSSGPGAGWLTGAVLSCGFDCMLPSVPFHVRFRSVLVDGVRQCTCHR